MERKVYLNKLSQADAQTVFFNRFQDNLLASEEINVKDARGRVTTEPVFAQRSAPHYYASAMDGIAVHARETAGASERNPIALTVGLNAIWLDTGDPIPEGFDAVIKVEEVNQVEPNTLLIERAVTPWQHVRTIGESVIRGQMVLPVNHQITGYEIGALLEAGITRLNVRRRPQLGIIPTGTEIVPPEVTPGHGELPDFNSSMLKAYAEEWGARASVTEIVPDNYDQIKAMILREVKNNDITITIAGSSAGSEDFTVKILQEIGEVLVHGVNLMPGKPLILAIVDGKPVVGLPGYPLASLFNHWIFVRPLIYMFAGLPVPETAKVDARVFRKIPSEVGQKELLRVNLAYINGEMVAVPRKKGSAAMESLLKADGIMVINEQVEGLNPASTTPVYLLKPENRVRENLLLIGSHDLALDVLDNFLQEQRAGFDIVLQSVGSQAGLMAIKRGEAHMAGAHLFDEETGGYNISFIKNILPERRMALINLVYRQQGLFVKQGNPKGLQSIADLTRPDVVFINRQRGAGTRVLLDYWLKDRGISPESIQGYEREEYTHISAAVAVATGSADAALGILAAAQALDLDFIPLAEEQYDLALPVELLDDWRIKYLIDILTSAQFKTQVQTLGGYRVDDCGRVTIIN